MNFPAWAPARLRDEYEAILQNEQEFSETTVSDDELTRFAQNRGFTTWLQYKDFLFIYRDCLKRVLTDESARNVWRWIADDRLIDMVWGAVARRLKGWSQGQGLTKKEFIEERDEIAKLSAKLAGKLAKHIGNPRISFGYSALVPEEYREQALQTLHPEVLSRAEENGLRGIYIGIGMPPLHVMLSRLSELVSDVEPDLNWPTKIHNGSGLRKLLLKDICWVLYGNGCEHSTSNLATFLYLILDDPSITDATIRGDLNGEEWWEFLAAQDSAKE